MKELKDFPQSSNCSTCASFSVEASFIKASRLYLLASCSVWKHIGLTNCLLLLISVNQSLLYILAMYCDYVCPFDQLFTFPHFAIYIKLENQQ